MAPSTPTTLIFCNYPQGALAFLLLPFVLAMIAHWRHGLDNLGSTLSNTLMLSLVASILRLINSEAAPSPAALLVDCILISRCQT